MPPRDDHPRPAGRRRPTHRAAVAARRHHPSRTRSRVRLRVRDLGPDDSHIVDAVLAGMSDRSRHLRFHRPMPTIPPDVRRALTDIDGDRHVAVAVEARRRRSWHPVGMGRIVTGSDDDVEIAVSVVDAWQGRGVGTRIVRVLRERAAAHGVRELVADVLAENRAMLAVLRRELPAHRLERSGDVLRIVCQVPGPWDLILTHEDLVQALVA